MKGDWNIFRKRLRDLAKVVPLFSEESRTTKYTNDTKQNRADSCARCLSWFGKKCNLGQASIERGTGKRRKPWIYISQYDYSLLGFAPIGSRTYMGTERFCCLAIVQRYRQCPNRRSCFCPAGTTDHSPAIYRWVQVMNHLQVPVGTKEIFTGVVALRSFGGCFLLTRNLRRSYLPSLRD
jgi:hypothetical protein